MNDIKKWLFEHGTDYSIDELSNLQELSQSFNQLQSLPESIGELSNLQVFWLDGNQLQSLPKSIVKLKNVVNIIKRGIFVLQINDVVESKNITDMYVPILELL